jgi:tetratricopeptide (TPR) repeat protein
VSGSTRRLAAAIAVLLATAARAEVTIRARLDPPRVSLGQSTDLAVEIRGTQDAAMPSVPAPAGVGVRYVGPSTQLSIVNGHTNSSVTHHFTVTPRREGSFTLGPITSQADGQVLEAGTVTLQVAAGAAAAAPAGDQLRLVLTVPRTSVYVHERVPLTVTLWVGQVRVSDVQYPRIAGDGFTLEPLGQPTQRQESRDGGTFQVVEFRGALTPARSGTLAVGPATMSMARVTERAGGRRGFSFFGGFTQEPVELTSEPVMLEVLPLPEQGKPADFSGAVGRFALQVRAAPLDVAAGDPVTLTYTLSGDGDLSSVTAPALAESEAFRVYPVQPVAAAAGASPGTRSFEQVIIPETPGPLRLPPVRFTWFDPEARAYRVAEHPPITLTVRPAAHGAEPQIVGAEGGKTAAPTESLGRDIVFIKESPGRLTPLGARRWRNPLFWILQVVPLLLWAAAVAIVRHRRRLGSDARYARFTRAGRAARAALDDAGRALERGDAAGFHDRVAGAIRDYLTAKLDLPPGAVTSELVSARLRDAGVADGVAGEVRAFFAACEIARFAPVPAADGDLRRTLVQAERIVRTLERTRRLAPAATAAAAAVLVVLAGAARAADETPQALFFRGNALYADGRYADAAATYERVLAAGVASANTYFNLGNAYLKAGRVGNAVLAYERAGRLAPGDPDLRANLAFAREQAGTTEPVPWWQRLLFPLAARWSSDALLAGAAVAWWILMLLLVVRLARPAAHRAASRAAVGAGVALLVLASSAAYRLRTVDLRPAVVVVAPGETAVRFEPSDSGTVYFQVKPGTTLRRLGEREGWVQVGRDDGRRGWIPRTAVGDV